MKKKLLIGSITTAALLGLAPLPAFAYDTMSATYNGATVESMIDAVVYVDGDSTSSYTADGLTITSSTDNTSGVYAKNGATVTLSNVSITTSGNDSTGYTCQLNGGSGLTDALGSQYGLDAAVYANNGGTITITGDSSITTSGLIANGVYATYDGTIYVTGTSDNHITIDCTGLNAHGVDTTYGGTVYLTYVDVTTSGAHASGIATDFGGGSVYVDNCTVNVTGSKSAGIYSCGYGDGYIYVTDSTVVSELDAGLAVASAGWLEVYNSSITGVNALSVMFSGDSTDETDPIIIDGSSLTSTSTTEGAIIWRNGNSTVTLQNGTTVSSASGILAEAGDFFGSDPSTATLELINETLTQGYELLADSGSTLATLLEEGTTFTGWTSGDVSMSVDSTSTWNVSADSTVTSLTNNGTVNLLYSNGTYYSITDSGDLSGSGTFNMNIDLSDTSLLNTITVDGTTSGTYAIYFTGQNAAYLASHSLTSPILVLSSGSSTATVTGGGDFGAYRWSIASGSTLSSSYSSSDYYLYNTYTPSNPAYAAIATSASNVAAWYGELNEMRIK
ncbi:MAG: hypothetical protein H6Q75_428 [Firmicutes bacterium]|nr:hypothetical protein [Bacillota bacterium]